MREDIWVDELNFKSYQNNEIDFIDDSGKSCCVHSLADYTNQVRKEVCEEIREWHDEECESLDLDSDFDVGYSGALSNLWGVLDQIEGKPKD